jgi:hypothetical protein
LIGSLAFPTPKERFLAEVKRMGFNVQGPWRISNENADYELCASFPTHIIVPCVMDKKKLEQVACFRSARRFPIFPAVGPSSRVSLAYRVEDSAVLELLPEYVV